MIFIQVCSLQTCSFFGIWCIVKFGNVVIVRNQNDESMQSVFISWMLKRLWNVEIVSHMDISMLFINVKFENINYENGNTISTSPNSMDNAWVYG